MVLGMVKMVAGVVGGHQLVGVLKAFPGGVLGVMLVAAAVELAKAGLEGLGEDGVVVALVTAGAMVATRNAGVGFVVGWMWHWACMAVDGGEGGGERRALLRGGG